MNEINDGVETLHKDFTRLRDVLSESSNVEQPGPIALMTFVDEQYKKALLLAAASAFEAQLAETVRSLCRDCIAGSNLRSDTHPLLGLVDSKVISREYSKWFSWKAQNANTFFSMFGRGFSVYARAKVEQDEALDMSIQNFLTIGRERNNLVHKDFARFEMERSALDVYELYKSARCFVAWVPNVIRAYLDECGYPYGTLVTDMT